MEQLRDMMDDAGWTSSSLADLVKGNGVIMLVAVAAVMLRICTKGGSGAIPEVPGSNVRSVGSSEAFHALVNECIDGEKALLLDVYADWCPPCRRAAPIFARWSKDFDEDTICFAKVNGDKVTDLTARLKVTGFPTFVFFTGKDEYHRVVGFREAEILQYMESAGAERKEAAGSSKQD